MIVNMKKTMLFIALFTVVLSSLSAHTEREFEAVEGYSAPLFSLTQTNGDASSTVSLADMKGRYVLVNFWDSQNPSSRIAAIEYDRFAKRDLKQQFALLSINLDSDERLFREIVRSDKLSEETQCHVAGEVAKRLIADYNLQHEPSSFLIDPQGRIIAINPGIKQLNETIGG